MPLFSHRQGPAALSDPSTFFFAFVVRILTIKTRKYIHFLLAMTLKPSMDHHSGIDERRIAFFSRLFLFRRLFDCMNLIHNLTTQQWNEKQRKSIYKSDKRIKRKTALLLSYWMIQANTDFLFLLCEASSDVLWFWIFLDAIDSWSLSLDCFFFYLFIKCESPKKMWIHFFYVRFVMCFFLVLSIYIRGAFRDGIFSECHSLKGPC